MIWPLGNIAAGVGDGVGAGDVWGVVAPAPWALVPCADSGPIARLTARAATVTTNAFFMIVSLVSFAADCRNPRGINILARHQALAQLIEQFSALLQDRRWGGLFGLKRQPEHRRRQQRQGPAALDQLEQQARIDLRVLPEFHHDGRRVALDALDADPL